MIDPVAEPPPQPPRTRTLALAIGLTALIAVVDRMTPGNVVPAVLYFLVLALVARLRSVPLLWSFAAVGVALTIALYFLGPPELTLAADPVAVINRALCGITILATAAILDAQIRYVQVHDAQQRLLVAQNAGLEAANLELGQREEEIARQNEELQSQTEEMERQGEELRVTNEDLAAREKGLEQLLELSRALTLDLNRTEVMQKVCDSLGVLTGATAAAILERRGEELHITCHHGFGVGPVEGCIPLTESFGRLVLTAGQTAYLEDVRHRADLRFPRPQGGEPFVSVLATPIRVRGRAVGTLEAYAPQPHSWTELQVTTLESVAAQLSISLQSAELFAELEDERRKFEAAFRSVPVGMVLVTDPEGNEARLNPAGALMLGVSTEENISALSPAGARLRRGLFREGRPIAEDDLPLTRALRGEDVRAEELEVVLVDGRRLALLAGAAPLFDTAGKVTGAVGVFADQTAHKAALREVELRRREAEEASTRKTRFLAALSHDIRTPANAINLMTEVLRRAAGDATLAEQIPDMAQRLQRNVGSLLDLVDELLDLARFDSGRADIIESEFSLNDLIREEGEQFRPAATAQHLELVIHPLARPVWLRSDRVKLARVLGNLIENAIKFTPSGSVQVSVDMGSEPARSVRIIVADTGAGIAPEHLPRIFDEFLQLRNPERDRAKGTGLGLAICRRLVGLVGGELSVESTVGRGTTFTIMLPQSVIALRMDSLPAPTEPRRAKAERRLEGLDVLLVEDHTATREGTTEILRQEGAKVRAAHDGASALAMLKAGMPQVVLLDLMLPDMDGSEILKVIRASSKGPRGVLVLTGDLHAERMRELQSLGPDMLIQKPIDIEMLVAALQTFQHAQSAGAKDRGAGDGRGA